MLGSKVHWVRGVREVREVQVGSLRDLASALASGAEVVVGSAELEKKPRSSK